MRTLFDDGYMSRGEGFGHDSEDGSELSWNVLWVALILTGLIMAVMTLLPAYAALVLSLVAVIGVAAVMLVVRNLDNI